MDIYPSGVDPTILRSVLLQRRLKKYPRILHRPPISQNPIALRRKQVAKPVTTFRKPLREKALRKPEIPRELERELQTSPFPEFCWEISAAKRRKNKITRDELGEKNPYSHPVEGVRHNMRNLLDPVNKLVVKKQLELPVALKYNRKVRRQLKAKAIVNKIYKETEPETKFVEKPQPVPKHLETLTPLEYRTTWKEIEMCRVMSKLKTTELDNIENELSQRTYEIRRKSHALKDEAAEMERTILENEKQLFDLLRQLVIEKDVTRQKVLKTEELGSQIGLLERQIYFIMFRLEELQKYGHFLYSLSPYEWRMEQTSASEECMFEKEIYLYEGDIMDDLDYLYDLVYNKIKKPILYFKSPEEFMSFFMELENVNFVMYSHSKIISNIAEAGTNYAKELTNRYNLELEILREMAQELNKEIVWEENQMKLLKDFCSKYIFSDFATLVYELEHVRMAVEDTYVEVLTTNDLNLGAAALMKELELQVVSLTESANPSSPETIKLAKQMNQEARMREMAQRKFEKTFREYELLLKELRRSFEYEKRDPRRKLMARSPPILRPGDYELTRLESVSKGEYHTFFGDDAYACRY